MAPPTCEKRLGEAEYRGAPSQSRKERMNLPPIEVCSWKSSGLGLLPATFRCNLSCPGVGKEEPENREILFSGLRRAIRHSDLYRRRPRHRSQQGHGDRWRNLTRTINAAVEWSRDLADWREMVFAFCLMAWRIGCTNRILIKLSARRAESPAAFFRAGHHDKKGISSIASLGGLCRHAMLSPIALHPCCRHPGRVGCLAGFDLIVIETVRF